MSLKKEQGLTNYWNISRPIKSIFRRKKVVTVLSMLFSSFFEFLNSEVADDPPNRGSKASIPSRRGVPKTMRDVRLFKHKIVKVVDEMLGI
jgi:hypothetical protein